MPIYEYSCSKCGEFEVTQRITANPLRRCPSCKGKVKKLISNTSFQLKGSGWYATDYAKKASGSESSAGDGESKKSETTADTKSETKSEAKSDSKVAAKKDSKGSKDATGKGAGAKAA